MARSSIQGQGQGSRFAVAEVLALQMEKYGDVSFLVGDEQEEIKASTLNLRGFSTVFATMFNENWKGQEAKIEVPDVKPKVFRILLQGQEAKIEVPDVTPTIFRIFLQYLVTEDVSKLAYLQYLKLSMEDLLQLLYTLKKYDVKMNQLKKHIKANMRIENATLVYEASRLLDEKKLEQDSLNMITSNATQVFKEDSFLKLSRESLNQLLMNEMLQIEELDLFQNVCSWAKGKCTEKDLTPSGENIRATLGELLFLIRFPLFSHLQLAQRVRPKKILLDKELLDLHDYISLSPKGRELYQLLIPFKTEKRTAVSSSVWPPGTQGPELEVQGPPRKRVTPNETSLK